MEGNSVLYAARDDSLYSVQCELILVFIGLTLNLLMTTIVAPPSNANK